MGVDSRHEGGGRKDQHHAAQTGCFFFRAVAQGIMLSVIHKAWIARQLIIFDTSLKKACPPRQIDLLPTDGTADI